VSSEVIYVVTLLLNHLIDNVKSIDFLNNDRYELLFRDSLLEFLRDLVAGHAPFCRMTKFQSKPILVTSNKSSKFTFPLSFENASDFAKFQLERVGIIHLNGAGSSANEKSSYQAIPANGSIPLNGTLIDGLSGRASSWKPLRPCRTYCYNRWTLCGM
jgi:hypothetical protein